MCKPKKKIDCDPKEDTKWASRRGIDRDRYRKGRRNEERRLDRVNK